MKITALILILILFITNVSYPNIFLAPPLLQSININNKSISEQAILTLKHFRFLLRMINRYKDQLYERANRRILHHPHPLNVDILDDNAKFHLRQMSEEHVIFYLLLRYEHWLRFFPEYIFDEDINPTMSDEQLETFISDLTEAIMEAKRYLRLIRSCKFQFRRGLTDKLFNEIMGRNLISQSS